LASADLVFCLPKKLSTFFEKPLDKVATMWYYSVANKYTKGERNEQKGQNSHKPCKRDLRKGQGRSRQYGNTIQHLFVGANRKRHQRKEKQKVRREK
jgi:hypothetical protein